MPPRNRFPLNIAITPAMVSAIFGVLIVAAFAGYFSWRLFPVFRAPILIVTEPVADRAQEDHVLLLQGTVRGNLSRLTLNGMDVYVGEDGKFSQSTYLASGVNILEVVAMGKFGRTSSVTRYVVVEQQSK